MLPFIFLAIVNYDEICYNNNKLCQGDVIIESNTKLY
nr:MAG TPA: hypothetical protein [Caudoviricetes sp.]